MDIAVHTHLDTVPEGFENIIPVHWGESHIQHNRSPIKFIKHSGTTIELFPRLPIKSSLFHRSHGHPETGCCDAATWHPPVSTSAVLSANAKWPSDASEGRTFAHKRLISMPC